MNIAFDYTGYHPLEYDEKTVWEKRNSIRDIFLSLSGLENNLEGFNSNSIYDLIELYDIVFFDDFFFDRNIKWLTSISNKMTRSAGYIRFMKHSKISIIKLSKYYLLKQNFSYSQMLNGISANNNLLALQLVLEHELLHAYQFCIYGSSNHGNTFKLEAYDIFKHKEGNYND